MKTLCEFMYNKYKEREDKDNMYGVGISNSDMIYYLKKYLLGENWCVCDPIGDNQINEIALFDILEKYSPKFKREYKKWKRLLKKRDRLSEDFYDNFNIEIPIKNE